MVTAHLFGGPADGRRVEHVQTLRVITPVEALDGRFHFVEAEYRAHQPIHGLPDDTVVPFVYRDLNVEAL